MCWPSCRNEALCWCHHLIEGKNHLFPLYVIDGGWMQTARGQRLLVQTIWTGSAATYFGLNQSLEDRRGADRGQEHVIDTFGTGKIKLSQTFSDVASLLLWFLVCGRAVTHIGSSSSQTFWLVSPRCCCCLVPWKIFPPTSSSVCAVPSGGCP